MQNVLQFRSIDYDDAKPREARAYMRILIADDHDLVRDTIAAFLEGEGMGEIVTSENLADALTAVESGGAFDLVLLDYNMEGMDGLAGLAKMQATNNGAPVAIISGTASASIANEAIEAGAAGFVPKTMGAKSMLAAIRFMTAGEVYIPYEFLKSAEEPETVGNLTVRETEVLRGLCEGKSNKEIARDLELQEVTIKLHVKTLCRKLDAKNRTQAAMIARDRKLV